VNVRIIAATNQKLIEMVEKKQFREDLFYRLNVIDIQLPLLRERKEDIIPLTYKFLYKFNVMYETNKVISEKCLKLFTEYSWPGNIRQLENVMERLVIISDDVIDVEDLPELMYRQIEQVHQDSPATLREAIDFVKEKMVKKSYEKYGSSRRVASDLQISQTQASKLIRKYCDKN